MSHSTTTPEVQADGPASPNGGPGGTRFRLADLDWRRYVIYIGFAVVFAFFAVLLRDQGFLSSNNLLNIFRQTATITVIAVGMTYVISCAEIDLSVGSVAGLSSVCTAMALSHWGLVPGVLAGLAVGLVVGALNGALVSLLGIPSFLVTLGMLGGNFGPVPGLIVWSAIFVIIGAIGLSRTRFGRQVLATGGNRTAAQFTGVNTKRIKFQVLLLSATVASVAGMLYAGRLQSGRFQWGAGDELSAIAAVILGGTSLFGGSGSVVGTLFGALLIGLINNGLILAGLDSSQQQVVRGVIIILAVALARKK